MPKGDVLSEPLNCLLNMCPSAYDNDASCKTSRLEPGCGRVEVDQDIANDDPLCIVESLRREFEVCTTTISNI